MHRVFCTDIPEAGGFVELESREKEHLFKVFRARQGDEVELLDGNGVKARGVVGSDKSVMICSREVVPEPDEKLHLCCALPRKQKLDQMLKQAAELGAWSIRPVRCVRSVVEGGPRERWDLLLREACKQSGNPFLPKLEEEKKLPEVLEKLAGENVSIYYGSVEPAAPGMKNRSEKAVLIGPEGGFAPEEIELMEKYNAIPLNFGPYILRLETAAISALTALRLLPVIAVLFFSVFFCTGCSDSGKAAPFLIKGQKLLQNGDPEGAKNYFLRAVSLNPLDPEAHLALAKVCDEKLDEPLDAVYAYGRYLELLPENHPDREAVRAILAGLKERTLRKMAGDMVPAAEYAALEKEYDRLVEKNRKIEKKLIEQQRQLVELRRRKAAGGVK
ncbi:MAG: RsmE family RNA methyltransferase [Lentisphaeria bacterium]|nr:RsmE family RNA methyltransferase [Lentisphaeria bacterium]